MAARRPRGNISQQEEIEIPYWIKKKSEIEDKIPYHDKDIQNKYTILEDRRMEYRGR